MHAQVLRSLHIGHASFLDQAHSLKLELACKLSSLHDPPPAPSKHLTRCLRNRVQARSQADKNKAIAEQLKIMTEREIDYFSQLSEHLGRATRYQFLAEYL